MGEYTTLDICAGGLGVEEKTFASGDADHIAETRQCDPGLVGDRDGIVNPAHRDDAYWETGS